MKCFLFVFLVLFAAVPLRAVPAGYPDPSFGKNGRIFPSFDIADNLADMVVQPDDKIVVAATAGHVTQACTLVVARYLPNGKPDTNFGSGGKVSTSFTQANAARAVALQADGKILLAALILVDGTYNAAVLRYKTNGQLDTSFGRAGKVYIKAGSYYCDVSDIIALPDGKIVLAGLSQEERSGEGEAVLIRLNSNGSPDATFNGNGIVKTDVVAGLTDQWKYVLPVANGKLVAMGDSNNSGILARYTENGTLDTTFGTGGKVVLSQFITNGMAIQANEQILIVGDRRHSLTLTRLNVNGAVDTTFAESGFSTDAPNVEFSAGKAVQILPDGKYLVAGDGSSLGIVAQRYLTNGHVDQVFGDSGSVVIKNSGDNDTCAALGLKTDGSIILAGNRQYSFSRPSKPSGSESDLAIYQLVSHSDGRPAVVTNPVSQWLFPQESASLDLVVFGDDPISYAWKKNGVTLPWQSTPTLSIASADSTWVGTYIGHVTNALGTADSTPAVIGFIETPASSVVAANGAPAILSCKVKVPAGVQVLYGWLFNGSPLGNDPDLSGQDTNTLKINHMSPARVGTFDCRVTMLAPEGYVSCLQGPTSLELPVQPGLTDFSMEDARVGQDISFSIPRDGNPNRFTVTGLPPGLTYDAVTGLISGRATRPGAYTIRIVAANTAGSSGPVEIPWTVVAYEGAGEYAGLIQRKPALDGGKGLGGLVRFTVTSTGYVSGQFTFGGVTRSITGPVNVNPPPSDSSAEFLMRVPGKETEPPINLIMEIYTDDTGSGYVTNDDGAYTSIQIIKRTVRPAGAANGYEGAYTWLMDGTRIPANPDLPAGNGFMSASVMRSGIINWTGRLADNSAVTGSCFLGGAAGPEGPHPFLMHHVLYDGHGSVLGSLNLSGADNPPDYPITADGNVDWLKLPFTPKQRFTYMRGGNVIFLPPTLEDRAYPDGFPLHNVKATGGKYVKPAPGDRLLGFPYAASPDRNGVLVLSKGGLTTDITRPLTLTSSHQVILEPVAPSDPVLSLSLSAATGAMTGTLTLNDPPLKRTVPFTGVLVPRLRAGSGFFLLPQLPDAPTKTLSTTPVLSGKVLLRAGR